MLSRSNYVRHQSDHALNVRGVRRRFESATQ